MPVREPSSIYVTSSLIPCDASTPQVACLEFHVSLPTSLCKSQQKLSMASEHRVGAPHISKSLAKEQTDGEAQRKAHAQQLREQGHCDKSKSSYRI